MAKRKASTLRIVGEVAKLERSLPSLVLEESDNGKPEWVERPAWEGTPRAAKLARCGGHVTLEYWLEHGKPTVKSANWCNMPRICQACAHYRGVKLAKSAAAKVVEVLNENPGLRPWLVTITIKNGPDLAERLKHLLDAYAGGIQRAKDAFKGKRPWSQFCAPEGAIISVEIKRGRAGGWHPHIHCLWLVPASVWSWQQRGEGVELELIAHRKLCKEWKEITGDSEVINAQPLKTALDMSSGEPVKLDYLTKELFEVFKYLTKPGETSAVDQVHAWQVTQGKRLVRSYGNVRGLVIPENLNEDPLTGDSFELWYRWHQGRYQQTGTKFISRKESDHGGSKAAEAVAIAETGPVGRMFERATERRAANRAEIERVAGTFGDSGGVQRGPSIAGPVASTDRGNEVGLIEPRPTAAGANPGFVPIAGPMKEGAGQPAPDLDQFHARQYTSER